MPEKTSSLFGLFIVLIISTQLAGCSVICMGIGRDHDARVPERKTIPMEELDQLKEGTQVCFLLKDSTSVDGRFVRTFRLTDLEYAARYDESRRDISDNLLLPELGEIVTINTHALSNDTNLSTKIEFRGVDYSPHSGLLRDQVTDDLERVNCLILLKIPDDTTTGSIDLNRIDTIERSTGDIIDRKNIQEQVLDGHIPFLSQLSVNMEDEITNIGLEQIVQAEIRPKRNGWIKGLIIGGMIDAALITFFALALKDMSLNIGGAGWGR